MAKIVLTNIYLVNWYGFINTKIPVGADLTLITGENECGKSTILDAVKYAFTGDAEFNKSSTVHNVGGSRRTLHSYTRCLLDPSSGLYARPADKMPNVYSHISLEYYDQLNRNHFVLGVILETNSSNTVSPYWYAMDHTSMNKLQFTYKDGGKTKPYDYPGFQKQYGVAMMSRRDALTKFMNMTGLKLAYTEISRFQRRLRSIMTYNPSVKIQQFIKESVLEDHDINFDKLRDAKNNIDKINGTLELIKVEVDALEGILKDFAEYDRIKTRLLIDDAKQIYRDILKIQRTIGTAQAEMEKNTAEMQHLAAVIEQLDSDRLRVDSECRKAQDNLRQMDCSKAIEEEKENRRILELRQNQLEQARAELIGFQTAVCEMFQLLWSLYTGAHAIKTGIGETGMTGSDSAEILRNLLSGDYSFAEKKSASNDLKRHMSAQKDRLLEAGVEVKNNLKTVGEELRHYQTIVEECGKNRFDYSAVSEQTLLIKEINKEFQNRKIAAEARFSSEYVVKVEDEEWRAAIEAFLGIHRYSIIVEPRYFDIANEVLDRSTHKYVELVNTKLLSGKSVKRMEDAVVKKLVIKNEIAQKYFDFWLGGIHAVDLKYVPLYESAMSKEGKLSRNMAVGFINTRKVRTFCLGQEAIELNRRMAEAHIKELEQREREFLAEKESLDTSGRKIEHYLECFKDYNFDAAQEYDAITGKLNESTEKLKKLLKAQENNTEYQMLLMQVQKLEDELKHLNAALDEKKDGKRDLEADNKNKQALLVDSKRNLQDKEEKMEALKTLHAGEVRAAVREYDDYLAGKSQTGGLILPESRRKREGEKQALEAAIIGGQKNYNNKKKQEERLPEGLECEGRYLARKNKIWVENLQEVHAKMAEQTRKYEAIFKNEFVLSLYHTALSAKKDIDGINKELRKLAFATRYQFDVNLLDDKSDYAKILRYAEYLEKTNKIDDGQMVFGGLYGYEEDEIENRENEIRELINRIIDKNDLGMIQAFADYRNYMSYEIIINNADIKDGKLSKQAGYNSGAGTQIPYTLILSAALSMLYNARVNCTRLIFIDEPFEKMSDHNIKLMLEFFKAQNFQVIFCAPPNKTDSIGYECDTIIPVLKLNNDNMQIGSVQFHDKK